VEEIDPRARRFCHRTASWLRPGNQSRARRREQSHGEVKSLQYSGSGAFFSFGQSFTPGEPWPRFGLKSYTRTVDYETPALRDEVVRAEGDPVARGGGLPIPGGQRLTTAVSGTLAWGQLAEGPVNPAPAAVGDRLYQLWITPHGLIKAALKYNATVQTQEEGGK
jgi:hypothetical protein